MVTMTTSSNDEEALQEDTTTVAPSVGWTECPEEEYLRQIVKEQENAALQQPTFSSSHNKNSNKNSNNYRDSSHRHDDDIDNDTLPTAIKLMDQISIEDDETPKKLKVLPRQHKRPVQKGTLEELFGSVAQLPTPTPLASALNPKRTPTTTSLSSATSPEHKVVDALVAEQRSVGGDLTVNQMIYDMEQQEEEFLFGLDDTKVDLDKLHEMIHSPSSHQYFMPFKRSLLAAMNAGNEEKSTNESLAGQDTVNDIILKMEENQKEYENDDEKTLRTWYNFFPIAPSVASREQYMNRDESKRPKVRNDDDGNHTTQSALSRPATATGAASNKKQSLFVTDETSVGSISDDLVEIKVPGLKRSKNHDISDQSTMVSSLSFDETYFRLGHQQLHKQPKAPMLPTTVEEDDWWVTSERLPSGTGSQTDGNKRAHGKETPPTALRKVAEMKFPLTPSTCNSDAPEENNASPMADSTTFYLSFKPPDKPKFEPEQRGKCGFFFRSLRSNMWLRCLVLFSAICFAAAAGGAIMILLERYAAVIEEPPQANATTPPPFVVEIDGLNVSFEYDGHNVTASPTMAPTIETMSPTEAPTIQALETVEPTTKNVSEATPEPAFSPTVRPIPQPSLSPKQSPTTTPTEDQTQTVPVPVVAPPTTESSTEVPASQPSPSRPVTTFPPDEYSSILLQVIRERLPESLDSMSDTSSPQYRALEWIVTTPPDEELFGQPTRIVQRWVLAVLFYSTLGEEWDNTNRWLTSSNECSWFSTSSDGLCSNGELVKEIDLRRNNLRGALPKELLLLSDNLEMIRVNGNSLGGTIPGFLAELSNLERLHLNDNLYTDNIPTALERLSNSLWSLELGQMKLSGTVPPQLGSLTRLLYLGLATNEFVGTLPPELGNLSNLVELQLYDNKLTGTVPKDFSGMTSLVSMELQQNQLDGDFPVEICTALGAPLSMTIQVDCAEVSCSCCRGC